MRHPTMGPGTRPNAAPRAAAWTPRRAATWLWLLLALLAPAAIAEEAAPAAAAPPAERIGAAGTSIGRVVIASGLVEAEGTNGKRVLRKGDPVFAGDVLHTDPGGRTQITFRDGARLAVRPATRLAIEAYHDADPGRSEQVAFRLERGGFRTATGRLGRVNRSSYRFSTPQAVIGVRGTEWGAQMVEDEDGSDPDLEIGVIDGGITVTNDGGSIDLGEGADFAFATVDDFGSAPAGMNDPPAGLTDVLQVPLEVGDDEGDAGNGEGDGATSGTTDGSEEGQDEAGDDGAEAGNEAGDDGAEAGNEGGDDGAEAGNEGGDAADGEVIDGDTASADQGTGSGDVIEIGGGSTATGDDGDVVFEYGDRCF
jgi:hypothetical protein